MNHPEYAPEVPQGLLSGGALGMPSQGMPEGFSFLEKRVAELQQNYTILEKRVSERIERRNKLNEQINEDQEALRCVSNAIAALSEGLGPKPTSTLDTRSRY